MRARYCSDCGAPVLHVGESGAQASRAVCPECGEHAGERPAVSASGILTRSGPEGLEVLLVRLAPDARRDAGRFCVPGRLVERGEDVRDTVVRAVWEQAGLRVQVASAYDVHTTFSADDEAAVATFFRVGVASSGQEPVAGADADRVGFFPLDRLPDLFLASERLVVERLAREAPTTAARDEVGELSERLHRRKRKYRELLEAYTNELMRGAWVNDLHLQLSQEDSAPAIAAVAAEQLAARAEVDAVRLWVLGPPDRCDGCPWRSRCPRERCLHLVASAADPTDVSGDRDSVLRGWRATAQEERVPLIRGMAAADTVLSGKPSRAELPGAGAKPRRFEGFPLHRGGEVGGVLGLLGVSPLDTNARRLFELVARHMSALVRNAQLVQDLRLANQVKLGFIARMSHELKTPLTAILGYSELLREELLAAGHVMGADGAATIEESGRKLLDIVESILEMAKLQSGSVRLRLERLFLVEVIEEVLPRYWKRAGAKGLALEFHPSDEDRELTVWADRQRLHQVVEHLLSNAIKFTAEGAVTVAVAADDEHLTCEVRDTGIGIVSEHHRTIFEAFLQVSEKIHIDYGGLGIGLSLAKALVELMGGRIWVESQLGEGSRFRFTLPRDASQHAES